MPMEKIPNALVGIAGVHYVAFELSRRGLIALPTIRNTAGYDLIVMSPDGRKHANIQVKASSKRVSFWPMPSSEKVRDGPDDYYVLLHRLSQKDKVEGFMLSGKQAKAGVKRAEQRTRERNQKSFPCIYLRDKADAWRRLWEAWTL